MRVTKLGCLGLAISTVSAIGVLVIASQVAAAATYSETTGGVANTWTNPSNAGGYAGPQIGSNQTVQIACKLQGFRVADGNTWWYLIASSPWNYGYYVSADPFYNNGQTSGDLHGTPFVDPAVPDCGSTSGTNETTGGVANTWTNPSNAGGTAGPQIGAHQTVQIACKLQGFRVADGNAWWYQIASAPWNSGFYVSADAFYNNGATSGSLIGTPWVDPAVPDCAGSGGGTAGSPTVTLAQGPAAPIGYRYAITLNGFAPYSSVSLDCYDSRSPNGFYVFSLPTNASGAAFTQSYCYSGDGPDHWIIANGRTESNHVSWGGPLGGGGGTPVGGTPAPGDTVINGIDVGRPQNSPHTWGTGCTVQDFNGGPYGWVIVGYSHGTQIVRNGMLWGWFDNGGGPRLGCPTNQEHGYSNGVRQDFSGGSLYWISGIGHAKRVTWHDTQSSIWSGYNLQTTKVTAVRGTWTVPSIKCSSVAGVSLVGMWVGVDGTAGSGDLVQAGVLAGCSSKTSQPSYNLFWQKVPYGNGKSVLLASVRPGQSISAKVAYGLDNAYTINLSVDGVATRPITGTFANGSHTTAECIVEAPITPNATVLYSLADFGSATFSSCQAATSGSSLYPIIAAPQHGASLSRIDMNVGATTKGRLRATPSLPLTESGSWGVIRKSY